MSEAVIIFISWFAGIGPMAGPILSFTKIFFTKKAAVRRIGRNKAGISFFTALLKP
jgi:hypothetical protein